MIHKNKYLFGLIKKVQVKRKRIRGESKRNVTDITLGRRAVPKSGSVRKHSVKFMVLVERGLMICVRNSVLVR